MGEGALLGRNQPIPRRQIESINRQGSPVDQNIGSILKKVFSRDAGFGKVQKHGGFSPVGLGQITDQRSNCVDR